jgi:biopolymer transport protein ExbD
MAPFACLFLLLMGACSDIFFGVVPPGFQKELNPVMVLRHQIVVSITRVGEIRIDGKATSAARVYDDMASAIKDHKRHNYPTRIALFSDKHAAWSSTITVLDAARQAGEDDVEFATR